MCVQSMMIASGSRLFLLILVAYCVQCNAIYTDSTTVRNTVVQLGHDARGTIFNERILNTFDTQYTTQV